MAAEDRKPDIILASDVEDFRRIARENVCAHEAVLEIGCSTGVTTQLVGSACGRLVAVDCSIQMAEETARRMAGLTNVQVVRADARDIEKLISLLPEPDVILLDVGGTAFMDTVAFLLRQYLKVFRPRLIIVRNYELAEVASLIRQVAPPRSPPGQSPSAVAGDRVVEALLALSRSERVSNRLFAARKLRGCADLRAAARLAEMRDDSSPQIRRVAMGGQRNGVQGTSPQ
jgi:SAM-dependent methyltransferase